MKAIILDSDDGQAVTNASITLDGDMAQHRFFSSLLESRGCLR